MGVMELIKTLNLPHSKCGVNPPSNDWGNPGQTQLVTHLGMPYARIFVDLKNLLFFNPDLKATSEQVWCQSSPP